MSAKCKCGNENWMGCKNCSKYKMVVLLAPEHKNLKWTLPNGERVNPVFYSPVKQNFKNVNDIINGMIKRFSAPKQNSYTKYFSFTRALQFYNNQTDTLIFESKR